MDAQATTQPIDIAQWTANAASEASLARAQRIGDLIVPLTSKR